FFRVINTRLSELAKMSETGSVYNELRMEQQLCDAVIKVDNVEFLTHKLILCNCSPYFRALFTHWSTPESRVFDIPNVSADMMKLIIEFAYTDFVPVTQENIQELFIAADRFNVKGIIQTCSDFLEQQLSAQNCIGIWWFTDVYYNPELRHKAYFFMMNHFEDVAATSEEFLQLSAQELAKIIEKDQLNVKKEKRVFEAILRWISYVPEERSEYISLLLPNVRLALMSPEYIIDKVADNELVKASEECRPILLKTMEAMLDIRTRRFSDSSLCNPLARPRLPPDFLFAVGGWSGGSPTNDIEVYDVRADRWVNISNSEGVPRAYHGTAFLNGSLYCVGGFDSVEQYSTVDRFDLGLHTWHEVAPMHSCRCYVSVTAMDGCIYAIGGYNGRDRLETAERYEPSTNQWTLIAPMNEQRSDASCTSFGGKVGVAKEQLGTTETALAQKLHISSLTLNMIDGRLFVVGGFNGFTTTLDVECYDVETGEWSDVRDMEISRSALSCCVVFGLPNMADYTAPNHILQFSSEEEEDDVE
uniref:BTB domain-containing protein n=1 Tax=Dicentrarchus labrax TaxID=13489 RepID=A0A8C4EEX8_DICLA